MLLARSYILLPNGRVGPNKTCWLASESPKSLLKTTSFRAASLRRRRIFFESTGLPWKVIVVDDFPAAALVCNWAAIADFAFDGRFFFHFHFLKWYLYCSDLLGAGSIWSSNVDSALMWVWIGPSNWWIGVDLWSI